MLIDLQIHSNYSDGYLTPTELVKFIAKQGVKVAALTDHNTVAGIDEFKKACREQKIKPIVGIELYAKSRNRRFNVLWYNFDCQNPKLHKMLRDSQVRRRQHIRIILEKLVRQGFRIDINCLLDKHIHYVPINHIIDGVVSNKKNLQKIKKELGLRSPREEEIISHYFYNKKVGVLHESYIDIARILKLKKEIGGQVILCHPAKHGLIRRELWEKLQRLGLDGVELFSPHHSINAMLFIQQLARELGFIETGGSDFHRPEGGGQLLQYSWQYFKIDSQLLRGVKKIIG
jgi:3',5'-nucleoside bisphosphate phosphatase